jgi:DNA-binding MarR family transcriptional regulator
VSAQPATRPTASTKGCQPRPQAHSATSGAQGLPGVRLGRIERALLLAAPTPEEVDARQEEYREDLERRAKTDLAIAIYVEAFGSSRPGLAGLHPITGERRSERVSAQRAARRLFDLGLIDYSNQIYGARRVYIALTKAGAELVEHYRDKLENGERIRWDQRTDLSLASGGQEADHPSEDFNGAQELLGGGQS